MEPSSSCRYDEWRTHERTTTAGIYRSCACTLHFLEAHPSRLPRYAHQAGHSENSHFQILSCLVETRRIGESLLGPSMLSAIFAGFL